MRAIAELYRLRDHAGGASMQWVPWQPGDRLTGRECFDPAGEPLVEVEHRVPARESFLRRVLRWITGAAAPVEYRAHRYWPCQVAYMVATPNLPPGVSGIVQPRVDRASRVPVLHDATGRNAVAMPANGE